MSHSSVNMRSSTKLPQGHGSVYKEVRFSPTSTPLRRTKSVSGSTPSTTSRYKTIPASHFGGQEILAMDTSYLDQSRQLLENQRLNFEAERQLFAQERQLWEKERSLLKSKIRELEAVLKNQRGSIANTSVCYSGKTMIGPLTHQGPPDASFHSVQVWEGSSPGGRPTRVFHHEEHPGTKALLVDEGSGSNPPSLDAALSPRARAVDDSGTTVSVPVPIEKLDSKLDGITLKSTALPPEVVARVITPPSPSPLETSPALPSVPARPSMDRRNSLRLKLSDLGPPNENLVRDAGHTPMAIIEADGSQRSTKEASPLENLQSEEAPLAPAATQFYQPNEHAESYFPEVPDDPALKGPLGLTNDEHRDNSFLNELDQKLLDQAKRILSGSGDSIDQGESDTEPSGQDAQEQEPGIKFKNSTNFGTAFGLSSVGKF